MAEQCKWRKMAGSTVPEWTTGKYVRGGIRAKALCYVIQYRSRDLGAMPFIWRCVSAKSRKHGGSRSLAVAKKRACNALRTMSKGKRK